MNSYLIFNQEMRHKLLLENANLTVSEISRAIGQKWSSMTPDMKREYNEKAAIIKLNFMKDHPEYVYSRRSKAEIAAAGAYRRRGTGGGGAPQSIASAIKTGKVLPPNGAPKHNKVAPINTNMAPLKNRNKASKSDVSTHVHVPAPAPVHTQVEDTKPRNKKKAKDPDAPKHPIPGFLYFRSSERQRLKEQNPDRPIPELAAQMWREMTPAQRAPWLQMAAEDKRRYAEEMQAFSAKKGKSKGRS